MNFEWIQGRRRYSGPGEADQHDRFRKQRRRV